MSEDSTWEWDAGACHDPEVGRQVLAIHNKKFKNNKRFEKHNYLDYIVENSTFLEVDITSELNSLFLVNSTNNGVRTPTKHDSEMGSPVAADAPTDLEINNIDSAQENIEKEESNAEDEYEMSYLIPVPKNGTPRDLSLTPISIMVVDTIGLLPSRKLLKVLFDPGSTRTLVKASIVPKKATAVELSNSKAIKTISGTMNATKVIHMRGIKLPEFDKNRRISEHKALIFDNSCKYDVILGADFLTKIGMDIKYSTGEMEWYGNTLPMREPWKLDEKEYFNMADLFLIQSEEELFGEDWFESYAVEKILDAKYDKMDIKELMENQKHLNSSQKEQLKQLFLKYEKLFDGTLGLYPHKKIHIEVLPDAKPKHQRHYSVPQIHWETFKKELQHLVKIGVLSPQGMSSWASPSFIIPKKDGRVRWVSDLRELNKVIVRRQYPLPVIKDV